MVEKLLSEFINRMTKDDVNNFAIKNGIVLASEELDLIFNTVKDNWHTLVYGNPRNILDNIRNKVSLLTYSKIESLYIFFKDKYKDYL